VSWGVFSLKVEECLLWRGFKPFCLVFPSCRTPCVVVLFYPSIIFNVIFIVTNNRNINVISAYFKPAIFECGSQLFSWKLTRLNWSYKMLFQSWVSCLSKYLCMPREWSFIYFSTPTLTYNFKHMAVESFSLEMLLYTLYCWFCTLVFVTVLVFRYFNV
jgi:hypothetical protein